MTEKINTNILSMSKLRLFVLIFGLLTLGLFFRSSPAHAAACSAPATDYGTVTSTVSISTAGTYRVWSRMMNPDTTNNTYLLEIDGSTCYTVGGSSSVPANTWTWVDYQGGSTSSKINATLSAGNHTFKMIGNAPDVKLDRIITTTDTSCVPTGTGDNCANPVDTTSPTASISAPTGGTVKGTVAVNATASDDTAVTRVEFYVDGVMNGAADTSSPYNFSWNSTTATNGTHSLTVKAYDAAGNVGTSSAITVTVDNAAPTVSLTAPANGATVSGTTTLSATANDNVGVTSVEFYRGSTLLSSDTTSPYSYAWNTTGVTNGSYSLTAKAYDAAGNVTTSSAVTVTVNNTVAPPPDTTPPTASITAPASGATISGTPNVTVSASDGVGVTKVELYVDGTLAAIDIASPYSFAFVSTNYTNGTHSLVAKAYDAANNVGTSTAVSVTINNTVTPTNPGDVNGDNHVTLSDLSILLSNYGKTSATRAMGDLNGDGVVSIQDLSRLLSNYGT